MIKRIWNLGGQQRWRTYIQVLCQWLSEMLVVTVLTAGAGRAIRGSWSTPLLICICIQFIVSFTYLMVGAPILSDRWASAASKDLQHQFFKYYLKQASTDTTKMMKILHQDLGTIKRIAVFYDTIIPTSLQLIMTGIVMVVTILFIHPLTVLIPLLGIFALGGGMGLLEGLGDKKNFAYIASFNHMGQRFLDDFFGMNSLIMYQRQEQYAADFAEDSENFRQKTMGVLVYQLQTLTIMDLCLYGALGWFVVAQGMAVAAGTLNIMSAVLISSLVSLWLIDFRKFGYFIHIFMSTLPKVKHIFELIDSDTNQTSSASVDLKKAPRFVKLDGSVGYADRNILSNVTIDLEIGRVVGLAGPSGSGKSTIARTLMKQLPMTSGSITVNNTNLTALTRQSWWQFVAYLGPESVLFDGSIEDNLLFGVHTDINWKRQLKEMNLCQFVQALPDRFETMVGENGARLSPGQRQQIAIARAILANKQVYIFDEITSNIDVDNARQILRVIKQLAQSKITMLITHRLDDIEQLDEVYLVDNGRLVHGTPDELANKVVAFKQLIDEQNQLLKEVRA